MSFLLCLFVFLFCTSPQVSVAEQLRVGIYDLPPLTFIDNTGKPQGLFVEVMDYIARQEGWDITYVRARRGESFTQLERGELDIVAPIIITEERKKFLDFPDQFVHLDWGEVIMPPGQTIATLFELEGKEIAIVRGSILAQGLINHLEQFHVNARVVEVDDYPQLFAAISKGQYEAGIGSSAPIRYFNKQAPFTRTHIIFSPAHMTFAFAKGHRPEVVAAIDSHLIALKNNPSSPFSAMQNKWLPKDDSPWLREYLAWGGVLIAVASLSGGLSIYLYRLVQKKITELVSVNRILIENREELHRTNQQFQVLLDGIPDYLMLISAEMRVLWMNQSARMQVDTRTDCAPSMPCYREWADQSGPCTNCPVQVCFEQGTAQEALMHSGEKTFRVKAFPIYNKQGVVESVIKLASDISDKVRLREENDRQNRLSAVGTLASGVAHEINNPVGIILSNLEIVCESFADAAPILEEYYINEGDFIFGGLDFSFMRGHLPVLLRETSDAASRIHQTVKDLKDFSRGGGEYEMTEVFPIKEAIERSVRLADHLLRKSTNLFSLELAEESIIMKGNQRRIEQVLINLLANACQALPDRNRAITLTTRFDAARQVVFLVVHDEGKGIPAEHLPKLATPFFTTRHKEGGTGLGLSVSFGIIQEHGGMIHFASELDRGTVVTITLPASIAEATT